MKRILLTFMIIIVALGTIGAKEPGKLMRFTVINKFELPIGIQLISQNDSNIYYYLTIPAGSRADPTEKTFTLTRDEYAMQVYYIETYDPVYGYQCSRPLPARMNATRNIRLVFNDCNQQPPNPGEPSMLKFWPSTGPLYWMRYWRCRYIY